MPTVQLFPGKLSKTKHEKCDFSPTLGGCQKRLYTTSSMHVQTIHVQIGGLRASNKGCERLVGNTKVDLSSNLQETEQHHKNIM